MKSFNNISKKLLSTAAAALLLAFNSASYGSEAYTLKDNHDNQIDVYEYNHNDARRMLALEEKTLKPFRYHVAEDAYAKGFSVDTSILIAQTVHAQFTPDRFDPTVSRYDNGTTTVAGQVLIPKTQELSCLYISVDQKVKTLVDFSMYITHRIPTYDAEKYRDLNKIYREHSDIHEKAHCWGANEEQAEYLATLSILNTYHTTHPLETEFLIKIVKSARHHNTFGNAQALAVIEYKAIHGVQLDQALNEAPSAADKEKIVDEYTVLAKKHFDTSLKGSSPDHEYALTGTAIALALEDFKKLESPLSESDLWSIATQNKYPDFLIGTRKEHLERSESHTYIMENSIELPKGQSKVRTLPAPKKSTPKV